MDNLRYYFACDDCFLQVAYCDTKEFTDQRRVEMTVSEFIGYWLELSSNEFNDASTHDFDGKSLLYLKDWHFVKVRIRSEVLG